MTTMMIGLEGIPIISAAIDINNLSEEQIIEYIEQAKNAYTNYFPFDGRPRKPLVIVQWDDNNNECDRCNANSMILLAKNVTKSIFNHRFLHVRKARYLLDANQDLYIRKVSGMACGLLRSEIIIDIGIWSRKQGLARSVITSTVENRDYGHVKLEPDVVILAGLPREKRTPRCIIDIEVFHRSPRQARELAAVYFQNPTVNVVVLLKVWPRKKDGTFAAICIVWIRQEEEEHNDHDNTDDDNDRNFHFGCVSAHEFGTATMTDQNRNDFSGQTENPVAAIPVIPISMVNTLPPLGFKQMNVTKRMAQIVEIPALPIIVNATNRQGESLLSLNPPIQNLKLNLTTYAKIIQDWLPLHEAAAGNDLCDSQLGRILEDEEQSV